MAVLRTNVVNRKFTFEVVYRDERVNEMTTIEAESLESAKLKLPSGIMAAKLREIDGKPAIELTQEEYRWMKLPEGRFLTRLIEEAEAGGISNG